MKKLQLLVLWEQETSRLIPLCHNIPINHINIEVIKNDKKLSLIVKNAIKTNANTGVEMEALTALQLAVLQFMTCVSIKKKIKYKIYILSSNW